MLGAEMGGWTIVYQIDLAEEQDADAFEAFMRDRYLPAVHRGPTRAGQVTGLALWRGVSGTHQLTRRFLLHMDFDGLSTGRLRIDDDEVQSAFDAFDADLVRVGAFTKIAG